MTQALQQQLADAREIETSYYGHLILGSGMTISGCDKRLSHPSNTDSSLSPEMSKHVAPFPIRRHRNFSYVLTPRLWSSNQSNKYIQSMFRYGRI
ncbi:hypothetical protein IF1G_07915 [Cordyceps javanica]|uniref:Uncharacterized protein n=1 Tax=Cordyceps javanica TaxID=43265 RepID=A0A545UV48_9HYPO|nr:hypothetical protein IF1G_07915 [Cordyceps javanica]